MTRLTPPASSINGVVAMVVGGWGTGRDGGTPTCLLFRAQQGCRGWKTSLAVWLQTAWLVIGSQREQKPACAPAKTVQNLLWLWTKLLCLLSYLFGWFSCVPELRAVDSRRLWPNRCKASLYMTHVQTGAGK